MPIQGLQGANVEEAGAIADRSRLFLFLRCFCAVFRLFSGCFPAVFRLILVCVLTQQRSIGQWSSRTSMTFRA